MNALHKLIKEAGWTKSSLSEGADDCVEASLLTAVVLRDSKDPEGPWLVFTVAEWVAFLAGARLGEFDIARLGDAMS
ncbi:DUF397 domain-containing protein [Actinomadura sp. KC06]|uniref:DUF397 domain-containing protein n=1 Tax=Actinomadura sp. KC06 TaxID=2530369 RepID=UPI00104978F8|nr:DUF397 domain-containing protein [Actinomadura sp. KC06]TDD40552.1 DUF397 domain-containing protein [Actinomadura sp. KC06]